MNAFVSQMIDNEISAYKIELKLPVVEALNLNPKTEYFNPSEWWSQKEPLYPTLAKLAQRILSQPATSVSSISIAKDRANLNIDPDHAEDVIFLREN